MGAYLFRYLKNSDREDMALRLPRGATMRDLSLNPVYQIENDPNGPEGIRQTAMLSAALRGRFREQSFSASRGADHGGA